MSAFKRIGLVGRPGHRGVVETLQKLEEVLKGYDVQVMIDEKSSALTPGHGFDVVSRDSLGANCDLVVVVGGDGSMLSVAKSLSNHHVPVLGINRGRLGFLTDIMPEEIEERLAAILAGEFTEETRFLIECELHREHEIIEVGYALNDIVFNPGTAARMLEFELFVDEQFVNSQQSDGLIVATPTGSTAYALSAGGPIMHPSLNALVLVPMYPHSLSSRPLVVDAGSTIRIKVGKVRSLQPQISCDGATSFEVNPGDSIVVRKKAEALRLIHPLDHNFYQTCRSKLGWGNRLGRVDD